MDQNIGTMITQILPLLLLITVIIFITIMPQRKREKQVKQMLEEIDVYKRQVFISSSFIICRVGYKFEI